MARVSWVGEIVAVLVAAWTFGCGRSDDRRRASTPPAPELARTEIVVDFTTNMQGEKICIQLDGRTLAPAKPLQADRVTDIVADLKQAESDPPVSLLQAIGRPNVLPMSECPERTPHYWWHVRAGPLRLVSDTKAEMVISYDMEGFPTLELCRAEVTRGRWKVMPCLLVLRG
jgi:hypothetical protein